MKKNWPRVLAIFLMGVVAVGATALWRAQLKRLNDRMPDDPSWRYHRGSRVPVKARTVRDGANYTVFNGGKPISVTRYFDLVRSLEPKLPKKVPNNKAMRGIETIRVTVRGYLVEAHFQRKGDKDMHATMSATPDFNTTRLTTELPPGPQYQQARHTLWQLVRQDIGPAPSTSFQADKWVFKNPPRVQVIGYVFFDSHHAYGDKTYNAPAAEEEDADEEESAERQEELTRDYGNATPVKQTMRRGWEIHPVLSLTLLDASTKNLGAVPTTTALTASNN